MSYSLHTLHNPTDTRREEPPSGIRRFAHEIALVLGLLALVLWFLALVTHSVQDAAFSTSGNGGPTHNWAGRFGAVLADASYFLMGFSVWWCVAAGVRAWFSSLALWLRTEGDAPVPVRTWRHRAIFWGGLTVLVCASAALETAAPTAPAAPVLRMPPWTNASVPASTSATNSSVARLDWSNFSFVAAEHTYRVGIDDAENADATTLTV